MKSDNAIIENNEFKNNVAKSSGGAIYIQGNSIQIVSNNFFSNKAGTNSIGGAIRLIGNYAVINKNKFEKNTAKEGLSISGYGNYRNLEYNTFVKKDKNKIMWSGEKYKTDLTLTTKSIAVTNSNKVLKDCMKDLKGNYLINKAITITINSKTYKATTNSNGIASVKISLTSIKSYKTTIKFAGDDTFASKSKTETVKITKEKTKLTTPQKTFKKSAKNKKVTITLKSKSNKISVNKKITVKVNGKTYNAKTNKKGQATINVNLNKKKTYSYSVKFKGDGQYFSTSKTGKIKIK